MEKRMYLSFSFNSIPESEANKVIDLMLDSKPSGVAMHITYMPEVLLDEEDEEDKGVDWDIDGNKPLYNKPGIVDMEEWERK